MKKKGILITCISWLIFDVIMELGQKYNEIAIKFIPDFFNRIPFLENSKNYFVYGTFDSNDIIAMFIGAIVGYIFLFISSEKNK